MLGWDLWEFWLSLLLLVFVLLKLYWNCGVWVFLLLMWLNVWFWRLKIEVCEIVVEICNIFLCLNLVLVLVFIFMMNFLIGVVKKILVC